MNSTTATTTWTTTGTPTTTADREPAAVVAIVYGRASKDRNKRERSIGDQITDCRAWCAQQGWAIGEVIKDADRSASQWRRREREGWEEALELIRSGEYGALVTWEPSRAGRDLEIYVQLRKACQAHGVLYMTHGRVYDLSRSDDSFMMGFEFLRAEADANTMRERQLRTSRLRAEKGKPHGRLPFGYRRVYDERTGELIRQEPDPHTGQIVRDAARRVLAGESMWSVAMELERVGEPTPMGPLKKDTARGWDTYTVRQVLTNPTIAGKRVYRGEVIGDAQWEALVSWEDFQKIQRLLADPGRRTKGGGGTPAKTLMVHIAKCHYCGKPVKRMIMRRKTKADAVKYYCAYRGCWKITIGQPELDAYIEETALSWFTSPQNLTRLTHAGGDGENSWVEQVKAAEQQLAELQSRLDEASDQYAAGELPLAVLTRVEKSLRPQIEETRRQLVPPVTDPRLRELLSAEDVRAAWAQPPLAQKRKIIKAVFDVRITQATTRGAPFNPERVLIAPRL